MDGRRAALGPIDVQPAVAEVDRIPPQRHQLGRPQAVPVGEQDHGGVAVAVAIEPGRRDQPGDLSVGQVLARPDLGVWPATRWADGRLSH